MNRERETELIEMLQAFKTSEIFKPICELMRLRRERYRDKLENNEDEQTRGRAKEMKDLLEIFS